MLPSLPIMPQSDKPLEIHRWRDCPSPQALVAGLDSIFFETAGIQTFPDAASRAEFRERWLGRYLVHDADHVWLTLTATGEVVGYLVGCLADPARTERFADIGYWPAIAQMTSRYPAHLHINVSARWRSAGVGTRLIEAFAMDARREAAAGMHVVTALGLRNVDFYARNRFEEVARFPWTGKTLVMLGRTLAQA